MFARELNHERGRSFHRWFYCCITLLFHIDADLTAVRRDSKPDYLHALGGKTTVDQTGEFSQFDLSTHNVCMTHLLILMMWPSSTFLSFIDLYASRVQMDKARTFT